MIIKIPPLMHTSLRESVMSEVSDILISAIFDGDFVIQMVLVCTTDTMAKVAEKVARHAVGKRVKPEDRDMIVHYQGQATRKQATVAEVGIGPLQHVLVTYE